MSSYQVLGGGPDPFAPKRRTLTSDEILRALSLDPNRSMDHGRIRGLRMRLQSNRGTDVPTAEEQLLDWSLQVEAKDPEPESYENPARLNDGNGQRRALTQGDFEFVRTLEDADPSRVPAEDVRLLAQLEAVAQDESERRW